MSNIPNRLKKFCREDGTVNIEKLEAASDDHRLMNTDMHEYCGYCASIASFYDILYPGDYADVYPKVEMQETLRRNGYIMAYDLIHPTSENRFIGKTLTGAYYTFSIWRDRGVLQICQEDDKLVNASFHLQEGASLGTPILTNNQGKSAF